MRGNSSAAGELERALARFVAENRMPGAAAAVVRGGEVAWSGQIGFADVAAKRPAGPATLYRIASITKTFTGTAVMQLRDAGRLALDQPAVTYLPELRSAANPFGPIEAVTIRRMLCHESGLAVEPPGTDWSVSRYQGSPEITLANAADLAVNVAPESQHKYSDLAYQLLGEIVTRVSGIPYPRYIEEHILDPLAMSATGFEPLAGPLQDRCATGYDWPGRTGEFLLVPEMSPVWAEGGLWSGADDLARWIAFQLSAHQEPSGEPLVLAPQTLREMHRPRYLADENWTMARASRGAVSGARTTSGSSTPEACPGSRRTCASTPHEGSERSSWSTERAAEPTSHSILHRSRIVSPLLRRRKLSCRLPLRPSSCPC